MFVCLFVCAPKREKGVITQVGRCVKVMVYANDAGTRRSWEYLATNYTKVIYEARRRGMREGVKGT